MEMGLFCLQRHTLCWILQHRWGVGPSMSWGLQVSEAVDGPLRLLFGWQQRPWEQTEAWMAYLKVKKSGVVWILSRDSLRMVPSFSVLNKFKQSNSFLPKRI